MTTMRIMTLMLPTSLALSCASGNAASDVEVKLCDNKTKTSVPADAERTRENGQKISNELMKQWFANNPDNGWVAMEAQAHKLKPAADNGHLIGSGDDGSTYQRVTKQDVLTWKRETEKVALLGSKIFHSGDELGSTIAVSCDMCHPHASNTHPETYPKFQTQIGRVALLRDMINWCIEHPVRGAALAPDSTKMRALEAYIIAQRAGTKMEYGKH